VPTIAEAGVPGYASGSWYGVMGPAGLPGEVVEKLNAEIARMVGLPEVKARLISQGLEPVGGTPEQFGQLLRADIAKFAKLVKESGAKAE
jgi:tripartite-type tricarboxylate transporter receptor subunit TctC